MLIDLQSNIIADVVVLLIRIWSLIFFQLSQWFPMYNNILNVVGVLCEIFKEIVSTRTWKQMDSASFSG